MFHILAMRLNREMVIEMMNVDEKLQGLEYRPLVNDGNEIDADYLDALGKVGCNLPADYKDFFKRYPLTGVFDKKIGFAGKEKSPWASDGVEVLECLYGQCSIASSDLMAVRAQLLEQLPVNMLAIGQVTGANFVCINLSEELFGAIYLWDREYLEDARHGLYAIAVSFSEFIDLLRELKEEPVAAQPKFVKAELSETLKARVAELLKNKRQ
ncbi:SMI1/KNR4 family protein [Trinickia sp. YCB016]